MAKATTTAPPPARTTGAVAIDARNTRTDNDFRRQTAGRPSIWHDQMCKVIDLWHRSKVDEGQYVRIGQFPATGTAGQLASRLRGTRSHLVPPITDPAGTVLDEFEWGIRTARPDSGGSELWVAIFAVEG